MSTLADVLPGTLCPVRTPAVHCVSLHVRVYGVCMCVCALSFLPPSLSIRPHSSALKPVKHSWDISPPQPRHLLPHLPSSLPSYPTPLLLSPQTPAGSFDTGVLSSEGTFPFLSSSRLRDPPLPHSTSQTASHQHKRFCLFSSSTSRLQMLHN